MADKDRSLQTFVHHDEGESSLSVTTGNFARRQWPIQVRQEPSKDFPMNQPSLPCPKCSGEMIHGFVIDRSHAFTFVNQWKKGTPTRNTWFESMFTGLGIKTPKAGETIPIGTFRCDSCGFLELYARDEFAAK